MDKTKIDFLYLNEQDMIKSGVTDMGKCVDVMCDVYRLMGDGDYLMGGGNNNSHGQPIFFPDEPKHPGMPKNGPDRRFMTMEAYLGGKYHICGEKWYGSNRENVTKGLPRSILMVMLNNVETGAPEALMSANLISSMRTGAIPGVGAKYLARKESKVCGLIGAGVITRTSFMSIAITCPNLEKVKIFDVFPASAERLEKFIRENYPQIKAIELVDSLEGCIRDSDIVHVATSGEVEPEINEEWFKKGAYVSLPAGIKLSRDFVISRARNIVDNWKTYEAWSEELEYPYSSHVPLLGCALLDYVYDKELPLEKIHNLGDIIAGNVPGRIDDDEIILFAQGGLPVYDVAWAWTCLQNAKEMKIGQNLNLWDKPAMV